MLDPTKLADWQIAEAAEENMLPETCSPCRKSHAGSAFWTPNSSPGDGNWPVLTRKLFWLV